jgi:hypothetical protein
MCQEEKKERNREHSHAVERKTASNHELLLVRGVLLVEMTYGL